jgi:hypothetical protein
MQRGGNATALNSATKVGVTIHKFTDLVQNLATEISVAKGKVKSRDDENRLKAFSDVFDNYCSISL